MLKLSRVQICRCHILRMARHQPLVKQKRMLPKASENTIVHMDDWSLSEVEQFIGESIRTAKKFVVTDY